MVDFRRWPRNPRYLAGDDGTIIGSRGKPLRAYLEKSGYLTVTPFVDGKQRTKYVHLIVCESFHGIRPFGMEVAHSNGIPLDCRPINLSWKTREGNYADRVKHGRALNFIGENNGNAKLTAIEVREIRARYRTRPISHVMCESIAVEYGVSVRTIESVIYRTAWKSIGP